MSFNLFHRIARDVQLSPVEEYRASLRRVTEGINALYVHIVAYILVFILLRLYEFSHKAPPLQTGKVPARCSGSKPRTRPSGYGRGLDAVCR